MTLQADLFIESPDPDWPCLPHGPGLLHGHVWSDADHYAVCGCSMRVTFAQLAIPERPKRVRARIATSKKQRAAGRSERRKRP